MKCRACTAETHMRSEEWKMTNVPVSNLASYLNDHLAGSVSALELIDHWAEAHKGEPLGSFFVATGTEIKADQETLRGIMRTLAVEESKVRKAGAWAAEKLGRARLIIVGDDPGLSLIHI